MALSKILLTDILSASKASSLNNNTHNDDSDSTTSSAGTLLMKYVDTFFHSQILVGTSTSSEKQEMVNVYQDWRKRLCHKYFGLSTFFITQNGAAKGGIRSELNNCFVCLIVCLFIEFSCCFVVSSLVCMLSLNVSQYLLIVFYHRCFFFTSYIYSYTNYSQSNQEERGKLLYLEQKLTNIPI